jgi:hypothetical protein
VGRQPPLSSFNYLEIHIKRFTCILRLLFFDISGQKSDCQEIAGQTAITGPTETGCKNEFIMPQSF